jgi:nucleoside-diphosphate-sugar epimerase
MARVLVTHADQPIGRRIVKTLFFDPEVEAILAVGKGRAPRAFEHYKAGASPRVEWLRVDLARHRPMADLFRSPIFRELRIDTVIHVPCHGMPASDDPPVVSGLPARTAEARLVLQHCLEAQTTRHLIAIGSAYVYRLQPGNANRLDETSELDLDPDTTPEIRSWIDCDMIFHGEVGNQRLRVTLLRVPTVVASGGFVYLNPSLSGRAGPRFRPAGFDPLCALISDKDVARAIQSAVHARGPGIYNVAGSEAVPLSLLARWTGRATLPLPGPVLSLASTAARLAGQVLDAALDGPHLRYGFTLDTRRAERELGFRPQYHVGLARAGDGRLRLETSPA